MAATAEPLADDAVESRDPVLLPNKKQKTQAAAALVGGSHTDTEEKQRRKKQRKKTVAAAAAAAAAGGEGCSALPASPTTTTPPLPRRCPPFPRRIARSSRLAALAAAKDPRRNLPTVVKHPYTDHDDSVASPRYKALVRGVARSTVSVSSIAPDGKVICQCTGIVIGWKETNKCARILTWYGILDRPDPKPKLHICLPNRTILEGQLCFFNEHYDIALLEISSESDLPLQLPSFGPNPNYGQDVILLARDEESKLMSGHGRILWFEEADFLQRNHLMFLSCDTLVGGVGGPAIDHDGNVIGATLGSDGQDATILAISTILTCIEMWMKFSRIARPMHGLSLRTVELLEVSLQEVISLDHNINNGYIVDEVLIGSTAEKLGIRYGDVIVSFDGRCVETLPELEDYLLSLGWGFLQGSIDSSSTIDLKLEVYDLLQRSTRSITLPVEFCVASE